MKFLNLLTVPPVPRLWGPGRDVSLIKATVPLPGGATAIYSGTTGMPYIRHLDWLGSARLSTTWSHTVQSKVAYAPFGETYNEAGASSHDRSFTCQDQDTVAFEEAA